MTDDQRHRTAAHEASHAIAAALFGMQVETVSIRPGKSFCGVTLVRNLGSIADLAEMRGRRRDHGLLSLHGVNPVPLFDPEQLRRASSAIMIFLAGPIGGMMLVPPSPVLTGSYVQRDDAPDEEAAVAVAKGLTEPQARHLTVVEQKDEMVSDAEVVAELERQIAGDQAAGRMVAWLGHETRRLVASDLFRALASVVIEELLAHDVIGGQAVHDALAAKTPRSSKTTRAAARGKEDT